MDISFYLDVFRKNFVSIFSRFWRHVINMAAVIKETRALIIDFRIIFFLFRGSFNYSFNNVFYNGETDWQLDECIFYLLILFSEKSYLAKLRERTKGIILFNILIFWILPCNILMIWIPFADWRPIDRIVSHIIISTCNRTTNHLSVASIVRATVDAWWASRSPWTALFIMQCNRKVDRWPGNSDTSPPQPSPVLSGDLRRRVCLVDFLSILIHSQSRLRDCGSRLLQNSWRGKFLNPINVPKSIVRTKIGESRGGRRGKAVNNLPSARVSLIRNTFEIYISRHNEPEYIKCWRHAREQLT